MALVDFTKLPLYDITYASHEPPVFDETVVPGWPNGPWTGHVYHDTWGYFTFEQSIRFEYNTDNRYKCVATFNINGVFTVNAEFPPDPGGVENLDVNVPPHPEDPATGHDETRFRALMAKYDALRAIFAAAAAGSPPTENSHHGTALDSRCIALPHPLVDKNNAHVYARPRSLKIEETQWPNYIAYAASLEEVIPPPCKVEIDERIIDKAVIVIRPRKPRLSVQKFAFANSSEMYFNGWEPRSYEVSGIYADVPPSGQISTDGITGLMNDWMDGRVNIGMRLFDGTSQDMFTNLFVDASSIETTPHEEDRATQIRVTARE